jgi:hypothetical protein
VRADLKAETKAGHLPAGVRYSVRISRYSMGQSLDVTVKAAPFAVINPLRAKLDRDEPHFAYHTLSTGDPRYYRHTAEARELVAAVKTLVNAYNRQDIDSMTDYYNVTFSEHVRFDFDLEETDRAAGLAKLDAEPACQVLEMPTAKAAREQAAEAALKAAETEPAPAPAAAPEVAPEVAPAPAQAASEPDPEAASEYTDRALQVMAEDLAREAGVIMTVWTIRVRNNGRVTLLVKGTRRATAGGKAVLVDADLACAL